MNDNGTVSCTTVMTVSDTADDDGWPQLPGYPDPAVGVYVCNSPVPYALYNHYWVTAVNPNGTVNSVGIGPDPSSIWNVIYGTSMNDVDLDDPNAECVNISTNINQTVAENRIINQTKGNLPKYSFFSNNCYQFVHKLLQQGGVTGSNPVPPRNNRKGRLQ